MVSLSSSSLLGTFLSAPSNPILWLDGGTGEELFRRGVPDDRKVWSATALVNSQYHDVLKQVHKSFLQAGAQAVTTNSYGVIPGVGFQPDEITKYCQLAGKIARQACNEHGSGFVFGSLGPLVASYRADLMYQDHEEGVAAYGRMVKALDDHVDAFLAETMSCVEESSQAVEAVYRHSSNNKCCLVSYTLNSEGRLRDGKSVCEAVPLLLDFAQRLGAKVPAILFNCCEPEAITIALQSIQCDAALSKRLRESNIRLGAYANRLTAVAPDWTMESSSGPQPFREDLDPKHYCSFVEKWVTCHNVSIVGGCCGITPEHIALLRCKFAL